MKKVFSVLTLIASVAIAPACFARGGDGHGGGHSSGYSHSSYGSGHTNSSTVHSSGYTRNNGTYVHPYTRTAGNSTQSDNFSSKGNVNPYTGQAGTKEVTH